MKRKKIERAGTISGRKGYEAEPLEQTIEQLLAGGSGIEMQDSNLTYANEYQQGADIRTDRFEVAINAKKKGEIIQQKQAERELQKKQLQEQNEAKAKEAEEMKIFSDKLNRLKTNTNEQNNDVKD